MKFGAAELSNALFCRHSVLSHSRLLHYVAQRLRRTKSANREHARPLYKPRRSLQRLLRIGRQRWPGLLRGPNTAAAVRILVAVVARKVIVPADLHADQIVFDVPADLRVDQATD